MTEKTKLYFEEVFKGNYTTAGDIDYGDFVLANSGKWYKVVDIYRTGTKIHIYFDVHMDNGVWRNIKIEKDSIVIIASERNRK